MPASQLTFNLLKHIMGSRDEVSSIDPRGESGDQNASMLRRHLSPRGQRSRMNTSDDWNVTNGLQGASSFQNIVPFSGVHTRMLVRCSAGTHCSSRCVFFSI